MPHRAAAPLTVLVVSHTHWDREWYHPVGRFRQRLVALVDALLDDPPSRDAPFLLDGQGVVLDDYLAVRPERRDALAAALASGALEAGPWYVLADELLAGGEALVRNLLAGRASLRALGAEPPPVLYSPDAFGHPAALPILAVGFGCPVVIVWRGYGGPAWPPGDTARWRAPDGTAVLLAHLPPDGYEFGASLPATTADAAARWARIREVLAPRAVLSLALLLNGADHHARQPGLDAAIAALARAAAPARVRRASLAGFAAELGRRAARAAPDALPVVHGELRASYGYTWTLQGTFAARAAQKRRAVRAARLLERDAEPWAALAALRGHRSFAPLLRAAWRTLLRCHPHDTLCGCSIDAVARAMDARLESAVAQGRGVRDDALDILVGHDPARARPRRGEWRPVVVVRNRAARPRSGVAELLVLRERRRVAVGPGGGVVPPDEGGPPRPFAVDGGRVPVQTLSDAPRHHRVESPVHYPDDALVDAARVLAWVDAVPAYGAVALPVGHGARATAAVPSARAVRTGPRWMENEHLRVEIDRAGHVHLSPRAGGPAIDSLLTLEDVGDVGDLYTHSPSGPVRLADRLHAVRRVHAGPLRGELHGELRLAVPVATTRDGRSPRVAPLRAHVALSLDAGAAVLRVGVRGVNRSRDHRLRLRFRTGLARAAVCADAAFGPVERIPIVTPPESREEAPPTAPLARYVTVAAGAYGVTLYADGLAEYEAAEDGDLAVTLLRAVGELSRGDLPQRPGHAGWPAPVPQAQALGPFAASFAVFPHGARDLHTIHRIECAADDVLLPLVGDTLRDALDLPAAVHGLELIGDGLAFSACKPRDDGGDGLVLRCTNLTERAVRGAWCFGSPVREASLARLDETPIAGPPPAVRGGTVEFDAPPRAVVTLLVR